MHPKYLPSFWPIFSKTAFNLKNGGDWRFMGN